MCRASDLALFLRLESFRSSGVRPVRPSVFTGGVSRGTAHSSRLIILINVFMFTKTCICGCLGVGGRCGCGGIPPCPSMGKTDLVVVAVQGTSSVLTRTPPC